MFAQQALRVVVFLTRGKKRALWLESPISAENVRSDLRPLRINSPGNHLIFVTSGNIL